MVFFDNLKEFQDLVKLKDDNIKESQTLDYKKERTSNKEIAKDVSSFANESGGVIIYGIEEDTSTRKISALDGIKITKGLEESIERIVHSSLSPELHIKTHEIPHPTDK